MKNKNQYWYIKYCKVTPENPPPALTWRITGDPSKCFVHGDTLYVSPTSLWELSRIPEEEDFMRPGTKLYYVLNDEPTESIGFTLSMAGLKSGTVYGPGGWIAFHLTDTGWNADVAGLNSTTVARLRDIGRALGCVNIT